jgi:pimeloyl-ACP methyl ester carboxylesterase
MSYLLAPHESAPHTVEACEPGAPRRAGRFAETRSARAMRGVFRVLCKVAPAFAAHLGYRLLARPPRSAESSWQAALREKAHTWHLRFGSGELAVYEWGAGPVVMMVHGWGSRATHMGKMIGPLVDAGFRVVAFDAPAHGASSGHSTDLVEFASAIAAVARNVGPVRCVLAHSFGASMSLYAKRDWGVASEKLVLISSLAHCNWFIEAFGRHVGLSSAVLDIVRQKLVALYCGRLSWNRMSVVDMLRHNEGPALIVHDEDDEEIPFQHGLALAQASSRAQFHATRGYGHHRVVRSSDVIQRIVQFVSA